jgi:hypothetical protein
LAVAELAAALAAPAGVPAAGAEAVPFAGEPAAGA